MSTDRDRMLEIAFGRIGVARTSPLRIAMTEAVDRLAAAGYVRPEADGPYLVEDFGIDHDADHGAVYVSLNHRKAARTVEFGPSVNVDYDRNGVPVGVEVLPRGDEALARKLAQVEADRDRLVAARDSVHLLMQTTRGRLGIAEADRDLLSWLYAEKVWQLEQERESRFRWAEEAAHMQQVGLSLLPGGSLVDLDPPIWPTACACVTAEQATALTASGFSAPVCAVHPETAVINNAEESR